VVEDENVKRIMDVNLVENKKPAHNFIDLTGMKFGSLTVVDRDWNHKGTRAYWFCICDCTPGKILEYSISGKDLRNNHTKSCGHLKMFEEGEAVFNNYYKQCQEGALKRKKSFHLTKEEFRELIVQNCTYSGTEPREIYTKNCNGVFFGNGLDRINNLLHYFFENCNPCCSTCNSLKFTLSIKEWEAKLERICKMDYSNLFFDYNFREVLKEKLKLQRYNFKVQKLKTKNSINTLTEQEYYHLATSDCFYCGAKPGNFNKKGSKDFYQGIDQIVHDGGYIYSNCVPCCIGCNTAKSNKPQSILVFHLIKIQKHQINLSERTI